MLLGAFLYTKCHNIKSCTCFVTYLCYFDRISKLEDSLIVVASLKIVVIYLRDTARKKT